ncbi:MAG TPA: MotA/TolQ/ExbB proton channel family protein [Verrucomicrobiae bacterium]|nr:MotA/TolQ/ExbB proton channel family protein [Verrucomicrobiae bacterium]
MIEFLRAGGPFMFLLLLTSVVGLAFIIERGLALRWPKVVPPLVVAALESCKTRADLGMLSRVCSQNASSLSRLILAANDQFDGPLAENASAVETRARHEVSRLERGLVVLEIVVGIAPLLGLVGTVHGLITLFADLGKAGLGNNADLARGIAIALNTTLAGLLIAIPSLVAWSYYTKKVELLAVEMETLCDDFLRRMYRSFEKPEKMEKVEKARH